MVSMHPKATDGSPGLIVTWNGGRGKAAGGESVLTAPAKPRRLTAQSAPKRERRSLRPSSNAHTRLLCALGAELTRPTPAPAPVSPPRTVSHGRAAAWSEPRGHSFLRRLHFYC